MRIQDLDNSRRKCLSVLGSVINTRQFFIILLVLDGCQIEAEQEIKEKNSKKGANLIKICCCCLSYSNVSQTY